MKKPFEFVMESFFEGLDSRWRNPETSGCYLYLVPPGNNLFNSINKTGNRPFLANEKR